MLKFAVIGHPLSQSLSGVMHNAMLKELNLDGEYETIDTDNEDLVDRIKQIKSQGYAGFNVTIPLKVLVTLFFDNVDNLADMAGCANTVKIMPDRSLYGYNTDIYGFQKAIPEQLLQELKNSTVTILGTGGASRAAAIALCMSGVKQINFYARNVINASDMVNYLRCRFPHITFNLKQMQSISDLSDSKMLVNSTPIGMRGKAMGMSPVDESVIKTLPAGSAVYDIVYNPLKTELLRLAQKNGYQTISGLDMFVHQGAKAFEIWTGKQAKPEIMKIAVLEHLVN